MDDHQFRRLLDSQGLSWSGYRRVRKGVIKRIQRHMKLLGCPDVDRYIALLEKNEQAQRECGQAMAVSISRFFRDRDLWQILEQEILPPLFQAEKVKVWSTGCACGEEVYSFRIVWEKWRARLKAMPELEMLATDIHPLYLRKAMAGIYGRSSLKEVTGDIRSTFFEPSEDGAHFAILPPLKEGIVWHQETVLGRTPSERFHLIFLRNNLLTYYNEALKASAFRKVVGNLLPGGFLFIGAHEMAPLIGHPLTPFGGKPYILQKPAEDRLWEPASTAAQKQKPSPVPSGSA